ncbi:hypothetical protein [Agromyces sp. Marseille-P2726]|uniref:hypothetical protein n=1 Tax=Agromyces sp. Marseille-P2726 TaxID=2709132 RepID=UPI00156EA89B|nr:hypothetical protein [Agromyces sp. Marseille-P2726]
MSGVDAQRGDDRTQQSIDEARAAADRASQETAETLDAMKSAAAKAARRGAAAVADAASSASTPARESRSEVEDAMQDAGPWLEVKYREHPVLVAVLAGAAAVAVLVWLGSIVRGALRR